MGHSNIVVDNIFMNSASLKGVVGCILEFLWHCWEFFVAHKDLCYGAHRNER